MNLVDRKWFVLKKLIRYSSVKISLFDRNFVATPIYVLRQVVQCQKNERVKTLSEDLFYFWYKTINEDIILSKNLISKFNAMFEEMKINLRSELAVKIASELVDAIELKGYYDYFIKVDVKFLVSVKKFLSSESISDSEINLLEKMVKAFISTKLMLGFSLETFDRYLSDAKEKISKGDDNFLEHFFNKFKSQNVFNKEKYDVFIPLNVDHKRFYKEIEIFNYSIEQFKFVKYSTLEKSIGKTTWAIVKDFKKDDVYIHFEDVFAVDEHTCVMKVLYEKAFQIVSVAKMNGIQIDVDIDFPIVIAKHLTSGQKKINGMFHYKNVYFETDQLKPYKTSKIALSNIFKGTFEGPMNERVRGFITARMDFESSQNMTQKPYFAYRVSELFCKMPYKTGCGGRTLYEEFNLRVSKQIPKELLIKHKYHVILSNLSSLTKAVEWYDFDREKILNESTLLGKLDQLLSELTNKYSKLSTWDKRVVDECRALDDFSDDELKSFSGYIDSINLWVSELRHLSTHSPHSPYDLVSVLVSETLDAFISTAFQLFLYDHNKKTQSTK